MLINYCLEQSPPPLGCTSHLTDILPFLCDLQQDCYFCVSLYSPLFVFASFLLCLCQPQLYTRVDKSYLLQSTSDALSSLSASMEAFCDGLCRKYPEFPDFVEPIKMAVSKQVRTPDVFTLSDWSNCLARDPNCYDRHVMLRHKRNRIQMVKRQCQLITWCATTVNCSSNPSGSVCQLASCKR